MEIPPMADLVPRLAAALLDARRDGRRIDDLAGLAPSAPEAAYAVQRIVGGRLGALAGWKVGAKGAGAPITCAPLFAPAILPSGSVHAADTFGLWQIESEIVLRMARDLPPRERAYTMPEVEDAIGEVMAGFEIVDSRFAAWPDVPPLMALADGQSHGAMVIGGGMPYRAGLDLAAVPVRLAFDGSEVAQAVGGNPAGDPVRLLLRLADHLAATDAGLRAGDIVATGSCTGMIELPMGATAEAIFDGIGRVRVTRER
jgi:2-keto-4-pentenoate hydratase